MTEIPIWTWEKGFLFRIQYQLKFLSYYTAPSPADYFQSKQYLHLLKNIPFSLMYMLTDFSDTYPVSQLVLYSCLRFFMRSWQNYNEQPSPIISFLWHQWEIVCVSLSVSPFLSASFSRNWSIGFRKTVHLIHMWGRLGFEILLDAEKDEVILYFKKWCVA